MPDSITVNCTRCIYVQASCQVSRCHSNVADDSVLLGCRWRHTHTDYLLYVYCQHTHSHTHAGNLFSCLRPSTIHTRQDWKLQIYPENASHIPVLVVLVCTGRSPLSLVVVTVTTQTAVSSRQAQVDPPEHCQCGIAEGIYEGHRDTILSSRFPPIENAANRCECWAVVVKINRHSPYPLYYRPNKHTHFKNPYKLFGTRSWM